MKRYYEFLNRYNRFVEHRRALKILLRVLLLMGIWYLTPRTSYKMGLLRIGRYFTVPDGH